MSCRVNESYEKSIRLHQELGRGNSSKKLLFHNTLDKSLLD
jgi:hypothetical protein